MSTSWVTAFPLADLAVGTSRLFKSGARQVAVFRLGEDTLHAVDNCCPHEGYPLASGTVSGTVLTCAWHNYKFNLPDGACVKGEEAVRVYPLRIRDGQIEIDVSDPDPQRHLPQQLASLEEGVLENRMGQVARDLVRLLDAGLAPKDLALWAARFDAARSEDGTSHAVAVAADALHYCERHSGVEATMPLLQALEFAGEAHTRRPPRQVPAPSPAPGEPAEIGAELRRLVEAEDASRAMALLRGAVAKGASPADLSSWLYALNADHFLDFGHGLIFATKALQLLGRVGFEHADALLPAQVNAIALGTREDLLPAWAPFRERLDRLGPRLPELFARGESAEPRGFAPATLAAQILDGSSAEVFAALVSALESGVPLPRIVDALSLAAAERLLRFDPAIDGNLAIQNGWLDVTHPLTYTSAVRHALASYRDPRALRLLFFAARFINNAKPLDRPPDSRLRLESRSAAGPPVDRAARVIASVAAKQAAEAVELVAGYLADEQPIDPLRHALEDFALLAAATRPIFVAHCTKTTVVAFEEHERLGGGLRAAAPIAGLVAFLASPLLERRSARTAREAIDLVVHHRAPRTLT